MTLLKYKGIFLKVLMVVAEHFEQITHADQYEGRIEARTVDAKRTGTIREASASVFQASADGLFITALVNKVKTSGDKSEVIGWDLRPGATDPRHADCPGNAERDAGKAVPGGG